MFFANQRLTHALSCGTECILTRVPLLPRVQLLFLTTYSSSKELMEKRGGGSMAPFAAGMIAEGVTAAFWVPLDIVIQVSVLFVDSPKAKGTSNSNFPALFSMPLQTAS